MTPCLPYFKYFSSYEPVGPVGTVYDGWVDGCFKDPASVEQNMQGMCYGNMSKVYCPNTGERNGGCYYWSYVICVMWILVEVFRV